MIRKRTFAVIGTVIIGWAFNPYLELLGGHPEQSDMTAPERMGLFISDDGVELLVGIDADKGLRAYDIHAQIADKTLPLTWRLSPESKPNFKISNRNGKTVATLEFLGNDLIKILSVSGDGEAVFRRDPAPAYRQYLVEFESNGIAQAATVFAPDVPDPTTGIVMIHGSGKSDRNNLWYMAQADYLAREGFTVLLPDKRGSGRSGGLWKTSTMYDLADDANAAVKALSEMKSVSIDRIGLMGLSQGGRIAPIAAGENPNIVFVVNVVGGLTTFNSGLDHESLNLYRGHTPDVLIPPLVFISSQVARARIPIWWFRNGSFDPGPYWVDLDVPGLIIWGAEDEFDNVPVLQSTALLKTINQNRAEPIDLKIYPGMGHGLFDEDGWISEDYLSFVAEWMKSTHTDPDSELQLGSDQ